LTTSRINNEIIQWGIGMGMAAMEILGGMEVRIFWLVRAKNNLGRFVVYEEVAKFLM
jgi:hypothetical protein